jgi:hypothetical protein
MEITHEEFQRARRISRAIQKHMEQGGKEGARTTDVYRILVRNKVVEEDRHEGYHFREFLNKLEKRGYLHDCIPQCRVTKSENGKNEWRFYKVANQNTTSSAKPLLETSTKLHAPLVDDKKVDEWITQNRSVVEGFRKRSTSSFTPQKHIIRKSYPRAYEYWSQEEIELMRKGYLFCEKPQKIAELLQRQPHVVVEKLIEIGVMQK